MPLTALTLSFECDQTSRESMSVVGSSDAPIIYQANETAIRASLFDGVPSSTTFVTDISNVLSARLVIRKNHSRGTVLIDKEATLDGTTTYSNWAVGTKQHFLFELSEVETNQAVPSDGTLDIYAVIEIVTSSGPIVIGFFNGEIQYDGITGVGDPVPPTLGAETANTVYAGPSSGLANLPDFRALVSADIPVLAETKITNLVSDLAARQPLDATLTALAGVVTATDKLVYATASDTFATTTLTSFARTLLDDADALTMRGTINLGTTSPVVFGSLTAALTDKGGQMFNVKAYGAVGDGVTNDAAAVQSAYAAAVAAGGGVVFFPPGVYVLGGTAAVFTLNASDITFRGSGITSTTLKRIAEGRMFDSGSTAVSDVTLEDFTIDGNYPTLSTSTLTVNIVAPVFGVNFRRVRLRNIVRYGFVLDGTSNITFDDCVIEDAGIPRSDGIHLANGATRIRVYRSRFRYLLNGFIPVDSEIYRDIEVKDSFFDGGWNTMIPAFSGSGGSVTYTSTVLTDSGATFSGITVGSIVRVMNTRASSSGTGVTYVAARVSDPSANFISSGVKIGDLVRVGTSAFGVVSAVVSSTEIAVEQWWSDTTRYVTSAPVAATAYKIYNAHYGMVSGSTGTTVTVGRWYDITGATVTPSGGTLYEVLAILPNYQGIRGGQVGSRDWIVSGNIVRRTYADSIALNHGTHCIIANNNVSWGQDTGISVGGDHFTIVGNNCFHVGVGGIGAAQLNDSLIVGNTSTGSHWTQNTQNSSGADIYITEIGSSGSNRNIIANNRCEADGTVSGWQGIVQYASASTQDGNYYSGNHSTGHVTSGLRIIGTGNTNTIVGDNNVEGYTDSGTGTILPTGTGGLVRSVNPVLNGAGAASTSAMLFNGVVFTGGTGTTTFPFFFIQPAGTTTATSWATTGTVLGVNMPSGYVGSMLDFRVAGATPAFSVSAAGNVQGGAFFATTTGRIGSASLGNHKWNSDGVVQFNNNAGTDFIRMLYGGASAAFPSIKRNGAGLQLRLADDSADTSLTASALTLSGTPLAVTSGGNGLATATLGGIRYASAANTLLELAGNTTATQKFLAQTGTGSASAAPAWVQPAFTNITGRTTSAQLPLGAQLSDSTNHLVLDIDNHSLRHDVGTGDGIDFDDGVQVTTGNGFAVDGTDPSVLFSGSLAVAGVVNLTNRITIYDGTFTAGLGVAAIRKADRVTAQSAANASISTYTVGASDSSFEVSMNMNVTAAAVLSTSLNCTYTDESNTSRTMIFPVTSLSGSFLSGGLVTATGAFETPVMHIRCKAATTITLYTAAGTFTGVTYTAEGNIKQTK